MPRPRVVTTPPIGGENDGWIWGSTRGGGGAPLRDPAGQTVANLRAVARGDVEVDYSPLDSPKRRSGSRSEETDDYSRSYRNSRGVDDDDNDDDEYGREGQQPPSHNRRARKSVGYADQQQDRRSSGDGRGSRRRVGGGGRGADDYDEYEQDIGGGHGYDSRRDTRDRDRDRDKHRTRSPINISPDKAPSGGSPKKFMNSIKDMNSSASKAEVAARTRKELDYQGQLREQIEEKRRKKEEEERKAEETKKKELEEYLSVHYKGKIPAYVLDKLPGKGKATGSSKSLNVDESIYNVGRKAAYEDDVGDEYGDAPPPRNRDRSGHHQHKPQPSRRAQFDDDQDDLHLELDEYEGGARSKAPQRRRRLRTEDDPPGDKWVSQNEYDELSALCDKLLVQQDSLQNELRSQAKLLKSIKVAGTTSGPIRARSVQNGARRNPLPTAGPASTSKAASMGMARPNSHSIHLPSRNNQTYSSDAPAPRVAFGRSTVAEAEKLAVSKAGAVESQQRKLMRAGGAATGKLLMKVDAKAAASRGRGPSPARPSARDPSPSVQGFGKLQQLASKVSGPLIVSYDDEGREVKGGAGGKRIGGNAARSQELSGESEYLRIGGTEVDIISGDQLDRLLLQARKARTGR